MRIDVITVFPDYLSPLRLSIIGKAIDSSLLALHVTDLRNFASDPHRTVDDAPFGGGPGMVMKPEPWGQAIDEVLARSEVARPLLVLPSASGVRFDQELAAGWANEQQLIFACGRYEGIDGRVALDYESRVRVREVCIGDYVLAGGEAAALVMVEAVARLLPRVLGNSESARDDSFSEDRSGGLLEGPVYTRPREWRGHKVPDILLSGDHERIDRWRQAESERRTRDYRPDLT
jgi:tRNA (guanine37-N1)-methyltransferase